MLAYVVNRSPLQTFGLLKLEPVVWNVCICIAHYIAWHRDQSCIILKKLNAFKSLKFAFDSQGLIANSVHCHERN